MAQPMTPAPDARKGLGQVREAGRMMAQFMAGLVSPGPHTLGAAGVAAIRAMMPGSGSYRQELDQYNTGAAPDDSVMDKYALPGESQFDFLKRESGAPHVIREVMQGSSMAAPVMVHASPVRWSGQPTRAKVGTGEGGAGYGDGLYASIPSNAKGIDTRYRKIRVEDPNTQGSFHVWDVPGMPVDWDAPLAIQPSIDAPQVTAVVPQLTPAVIEYARARVRGEPRSSLRGLADKAESSLADMEHPEIGGLGMYAHEAANPLLESPADSAQAREILAKLSSARAILGHQYLGEAVSGRVSGVRGDVPNFVIYDDAAVKPLGTFNSAEEYLASELRKRLQPRIDAEDALRKSGQATPEAYAKIRAMFAAAVGGGPNG